MAAIVSTRVTRLQAITPRAAVAHVPEIVSFNASATSGLQLGTGTWNSSGVITGGTGVTLTAAGLFASVAGALKFSLDAATGAAVFAGSLSAATGTFSGALSAATGTFSGTVSAGAITSSSYIDVTGYIKASGTVGFDSQFCNIVGDQSGVGYVTIYGRATGSGGTAVWGNSTSASGGQGVRGDSSYGTGVYGLSTHTGGYAGAFVASGGATGLYVDGAIQLLSQTVSTGGATATFPGNDKPGSNSSVAWLTVSINGATRYIPTWS